MIYVDNKNSTVKALNLLSSMTTFHQEKMFDFNIFSQIMKILTNLLKNSDLTIVYFTIKAYRTITFICSQFKKYNECKIYYTNLFKYLENHSSTFIKSQTCNVVMDIIHNKREIIINYGDLIVNTIAKIMESANSMINSEDDLHIIFSLTNTITCLSTNHAELDLPFSDYIPILFNIIDKIKIFPNNLKQMGYLLITNVNLITSDICENREEQQSYIIKILDQMNYFMKEIKKSDNPKKYRKHCLSFVSLLSKYNCDNLEESTSTNEFFLGAISTLFDAIINFDKNKKVKTFNYGEKLKYDIFSQRCYHLSSQEAIYSLIMFLIENFKKEYLQNAKQVFTKIRYAYHKMGKSSKYEDYCMLLECFTFNLELLVSHGKIDEAYDVWNGNLGFKNVFFEFISDFSHMSYFRKCSFESFFECIKAIGTRAISSIEVDRIVTILNEKLRSIFEFVAKYEFLIQMNPEENYLENKSKGQYIMYCVKMNKFVKTRIVKFLNNLCRLFHDIMPNSIETMYDDILCRRHNYNHNEWIEVSLCLFKNIAKFFPGIVPKYFFVMEDLNRKLALPDNTENGDWSAYLCNVRHYSVIAKNHISEFYKYIIYSVPFLKDKFKLLDDLTYTNVNIELNDQLVDVFAKYLYYVPHLFQNIDDEIKDYVKTLPIISIHCKFNLNFVFDIMDTKFNLIKLYERRTIVNLIYAILFMEDKCQSLEILQRTPMYLELLEVLI